MAKKAIKKMASETKEKPNFEKMREERRAAYEAKRKPEREERAKKVEALAAQMKKRGIDVDSIKEPRFIGQIGRLLISKEGKPSIDMRPKPRSAGMKFKSLIKRVLKAAHSVLTGSHLNVAKKQPVTGEPKTAIVPIGAKIKRYETKKDFEKSSKKS